MQTFFTSLIVSLFLLVPSAFAAEQTIMLNVKGMSCASCPYQVQSALKRVDGVISATASLEKHNAVVTYDDSKTDVAALTKATADAGFPSTLVEPEKPKDS